MSKPVLEAVPFTNDMCHTIQPGDPVLVITCSTGTVAVRKGTYLGTRRPGSRSESVQVEAQQPVTEWRHKVTNELMGWRVPGMRMPSRPYEWEAKYGIIRRNPFSYTPDRIQTPEQKDLYEKDFAEFKAKEAEYQAAWNAYKAQHHEVERIRTYKTSLQRNRIYPLNISIDTLIKAI